MLNSSIALSMIKTNPDTGEITLSASEATELVKKIQVLQAENESLKKQVTYLEKAREDEHEAFNKQIKELQYQLDTKGLDDVVDRLMYVLLGAGSYSILMGVLN